RTKVTDAGLTHLGRMATLARLELGKTAVSSAGGKDLAGLKSLTMLAVDGTKFGDPGLKDLVKGSADLIYLKLSNTPTTDAGVKLVAGRYTQIVTLILDGTKVGDPAVTHLGGLKSLTYLSISQTGVTNTGGKVLKLMQQLEYLNVYQTRMGDPMIR